MTRKPRAGFLTLCAPVHVHLRDELDRPFPVFGQAEMCARSMEKAGIDLVLYKNKRLVDGPVDSLQVENFNGDIIVDSKEKMIEASAQLMNADIDCLVLFFPTWMWTSHYTQSLMKMNIPIILWSGSVMTGCQNVGLWGMHGTLDEIGIEHKLVYGMPDDKKVLSNILVHARAAMVKNVLSKSKIGLFGSKCMDMIPGLINDAEWLSKFGIESEHLDQYYLIIEAQKVTKKEIEDAYAEVKNSVAELPPLNEGMEKQIRMYVAHKKLVKEHNIDFDGVKCVFELSDNYCSPCVGQCMMQTNGFITACCGEPKGALTMYIMRILSDEPIFQADVEAVDISKKIVRMVSCGSAPITMGNASNTAKSGKFVEKPPMEGEAGGICLDIEAKPGKITFARISKIKDRYVMHISKGEVFKDTYDERKETGWPSMPYAALKLDGDPEKFIQNLRSQYMHFCYGDLTGELIEVCNLLDIETIIS